MKFYDGPPIGRQAQIRRMRAEVDALAAKSAPEDPKTFIVQRPDDGAMKIRLRKLRIGEQLRKHDLRLDHGGRLVPLALRGWRRLFGYGLLIDVDPHHFRVVP